MPAASQPASPPEDLTIIVPTLNEAPNIRPLLTRIFSQKSPAFQVQVLFVDDGSTDGTCERIARFAETHPVQLFKRENPRGGLAGAVLEGAALAKASWVLVMDADLSHPPERIGDLMAPLFDGSEDMVIGSRYARGGRTPGWPWWRRSMSRIACLLARPLTRVKDPLSGFFATRRSTILDCEPNVAGFKIALELIVRAKHGFRVRELPVVFRDRIRGESKMRLRVLLIYLARLGTLLGRQTRNDFRLFREKLVATLLWNPFKRRASVRKGSAHNRPVIVG